MEAQHLFASVGEVGERLHAQPGELERVRTGRLLRGLAARTGRPRSLLRGQPPLGDIATLCRIGFAALALGDGAEARERFGEALERAHASQAISLELLALSGIGACLAEDPAEQERAAVILTFATSHEQLPPSYAFAARPALDRLQAELPPEQLAAAREAAAAATLEELERTATYPSDPRSEVGQSGLEPLPNQRLVPR